MSCEVSGSKSKLSPCAFGLALGVVKGLWMVLAAWSAWLFGYGAAMVDHIASFYHGYGASFSGGLIGGLYGLICGFIFGIVFGFFYNRFLHMCCKKCESKE